MGSSSSSAPGPRTSARAIATRAVSPPESSRAAAPGTPAQPRVGQRGAERLLRGSASANARLTARRPAASPAAAPTSPTRRRSSHGSSSRASCPPTSTARPPARRAAPGSAAGSTSPRPKARAAPSPRRRPLPGRSRARPPARRAPRPGPGSRSRAEVSPVRPALARTPRSAGVAEQPEADLLDLRVLVQRRPRGGDRDLRGARRRVAVDAGRDRRERDRAAAVLGRELDRPPVAGRQQLRLALAAAVPDRPDGVDDVVDGQPPGAGDLRVARVAAAEPAALLEQLRPGRAVDRAVDAAAPEQARVRGVDDRVGRRRPA